MQEEEDLKEAPLECIDILVVIDNSRYHARLEHFPGFGIEVYHIAMHFIEHVEIVDVFDAKVGQQALPQHLYRADEVILLRLYFVLGRIPDAQLDHVDQGSAHRNDQRVGQLIILEIRLRLRVKELVLLASGLVPRSSGTLNACVCFHGLPKYLD